MAAGISSQVWSVTRDRVMEAAVSTASADSHSNGALGFAPPLGDSVPIRQIISRKINGHTFRSSRFHVDVRKAF